MSRELLRPAGVQAGVSCVEALSATAWPIQVQVGPGMSGKKQDRRGREIMRTLEVVPRWGSSCHVLAKRPGAQLCQWLRSGGVRRGGRGPDRETIVVMGSARPEPGQ